MPRFQLLAPAKNVCGGGVLLAIFAWVTWAITFGTFAALSDLPQLISTLHKIDF